MNWDRVTFLVENDANLFLCNDDGRNAFTINRKLKDRMTSIHQKHRLLKSITSNDDEKYMYCTVLDTIIF